MRDLLEQLETGMRHEFEQLRAKFEHSGNKGVGAETILRNFLHLYLPRRYGVGHGEIVDSQGRRSPQTDIVIVTEEHPFTFTSDQPGLFFVEGVFAVGEVKSVLTTEELERTIASALKFRELRCRPLGHRLLLSLNHADQDRFVGKPPYFLFAFETHLALETLGEVLATRTNRSIDAVFVLNKGVVLDFGDGKGSMCFARPDGTTCGGWASVPDSKLCLARLLLWLSLMPHVQHGDSFLPRYLSAALTPPSGTAPARLHPRGDR